MDVVAAEAGDVGEASHGGGQLVGGVGAGGELVQVVASRVVSDEHVGLADGGVGVDEVVGFLEGDRDVLRAGVEWFACGEELADVGDGVDWVLADHEDAGTFGFGVVEAGVAQLGEFLEGFAHHEVHAGEPHLAFVHVLLGLLLVVEAGLFPSGPLGLVVRVAHVALHVGLEERLDLLVRVADFVEHDANAVFSA